MTHVGRFALCAAMISSCRAPEKSVMSKPLPTTPATANFQPASSDPSAWNTPRPVPSSELRIGPACNVNSDCNQYPAGPCTDPPNCFGAAYCRPVVPDGVQCDTPDSDQGVCERGLCVDPSQRPRICGQLVAFFQVALVGRDMDFAAVCNSQKCLDDMRAVVDRLPTDIGKYFAECLAGTGGFGFPELSVDFDPNAPYALPYLPPQGQSPESAPKRW